MKQEIGNESIQCEKILLENIKTNLKNKNNAEELKTKPYNEKSQDKNSNTQANEAQINESFSVDDYVEKIEKFIEGEINHLNKFKFFIGDFKEKSKKYMSLDKFKNNSKAKNVLNSSTNEEDDLTQADNRENKWSNSENLSIINKLRGIV